MKNQLAKLNKWNRILAAIYFVEAVLIVVIGKSYSVPVTIGYSTIDTLATKAAGHTVLAPANRHLFDVNLIYLIVGWLLISAVSYLLIATFFRTGYEADIRKNLNRARWLSFGLSAGLMMVTVALLTGIYDTPLLLAIFVLTLVAKLTGWLMEPSKPFSWLPFVLGFMAAVTPWVILAKTVWAINVYGTGQLPGFVYGIYASMAVLFSLFAVNAYLQYAHKGRWAKYLESDKMFTVIILLVQSILAWQIFFGVLKP